MTMLKVTKKQGFTLSLGNTFLENLQEDGGRVGQTDPPAFLELKCRVPVYPLLYI